MFDVIDESDMSFLSENTFQIEKSEVYSSMKEEIKTVEFIRAMGGNLLFVEAKTSFPNPNNPDVDNVERFNSEIDAICDKFKHSLNLFSAVEVGVLHDAAAVEMVLPENVSLTFLLVIKNHEEVWCKPIEAKLIGRLPGYLKKIWKPTVQVINHQTAIERNLVIR
jgi:hypothetical protein